LVPPKPTASGRFGYTTASGRLGYTTASGRLGNSIEIDPIRYPSRLIPAVKQRVAALAIA